MRTTSMFLGSAILAIAAISSSSLLAGTHPRNVFMDAQRCRISGTVDYGCYQQRLGLFEQFVLKDDASWMQKLIVAEALVKTYDAMHLESTAGAAVRTKTEIYRKALAALDVSERGQVDDCKDEANPDGCLKDRYCFKEGYIKAKNVLVTDHPELFAEELRWFDRQARGNC